MRIGISLFLLAGSLCGCAVTASGGERNEGGASTAQSSAVSVSDADTQVDGAEKVGAVAGESKASYFSQLWELEKSTRRARFTIAPHRDNYFLPLSYNASPNVAAVREVDPNAAVKKLESLFQLSLKVKLWEDLFGEPIDLWGAYTQRSFWQVYDFEDSSPFRETDYEPELLLNLRTDYDLLGFRGRFINAGFNHQSNGQTEPLSRSWNRLVANFGFERGPFALLVKTWYRLPESTEDDDNPHIEDFLGYGELWGYYFWKQHRFGIMFRDNLHLDDNRGAVQAEWSFPMLERIDGYIQYFNGYGESLLDYNHSINRISVGFRLAL